MNGVVVPNRNSSRRPARSRGRPSVWTIGALIVVGAAAFVGVSLAPSWLDSSKDIEDAVSLALRLTGFAAILAAGALLVRRSRR